MTESEYIRLVKVKLDEVSPFDEPTTFIATGGDASVKPIETTIKECLPNAAELCLNVLPTVLLSADIDEDTYTAHIDVNSVGHITDIEEYARPVSLSVDGGYWDREVGSFITPLSPAYLLQKNKFTRGGSAKPVAAFVPEKREIELYSFPKSITPKDKNDHAHVHATLYYIDTHKAATSVQSKIEDFIVLRCAAYVAEIMSANDAAQVFIAEFKAKLEGVIQ